MAANSQLGAFTLDDFEARSGSATSIIRTIAGLYIRHESTPVARGKVLDLAGAAGVSAPAAQTAVSRLIDKSILENTDESRLRVPEAAQAMFARGNRRIFTPRQMRDEDQWCLAAYSLPESMRPVRHQLRKHFGQLGGGLAAAGLWIFPAYLHEEVLQILTALQVRTHATVFIAQTPDFPSTPAEAAKAWWDLDRLEALHHSFLAHAEQLPEADTDEMAYRNYVLMIDAWRTLPYLDPGLPPMMLPEHWPGTSSRRRFAELSEALEHRASHFASRLLRA